MPMRATRRAPVRLGLLASFVAAANGFGPRTRPQNPTNLTVYALRPVHLIGLEDKDSADVAGDIFFWIKDRILHPMHCRRDPSWNQCGTSGILETGNQVYAEFVVEYDSQRMGSYQSCNPDPADPTGATWDCNCHGHGASSCSGIGSANITNFASPSGQFPGDTFSPLLAKVLDPGLWVSTVKQGECGPGSQCQWRVAAKGRMVNASCLNANLVSAVGKAAGGAVEKCEGAVGAPLLEVARARTCDFLNATRTNLSDCCIEAFFKGISAMTRAALMLPFQRSFETADPAAGGCPSVWTGPPALPGRL